MNIKNKQRAKLALAELEKEMEVLTTEEASTCKGGIGQYDKDCFWRCVAYFKLGGTITEAMAEPFARDFFMWCRGWSESEADQYLKKNGAGMTTELLRDFKMYAIEKGINPISGGFGGAYIADFNTCDVSSYYCNGYRHAVVVKEVRPDGSMIIVDPQNNNAVTHISKQEAEKLRKITH
ncbi:hypothetical protein [Capnocytophaga canimorsus]|uniref:hypothetical protein n=1 Tax=Capnocytophaga canimorsus TaxID=28188 RepID=UPI001EDCE82B|nr:hypothetical protein [Capnocytophaga canimorsus]GJQ04877.1 hypothetical protein CAPN009_12920 [Capnocytophaga canimorsus]